MKKNHYLFTSESVSEGHPDKVADQISDNLLDNLLALDPDAHVAIESMVTTGQVIVAGEVKTSGYVDVQKVTRETIKNIGYTRDDYYFSYKSLGVLSAIHDQSEDITRGVIRKEDDKQGAGDQGMMFGYAVDETPQLMPLTISLAHDFMRELAYIRKHTDLMPYLRPDAKSQVTVEYDENHRPAGLHTIVISTQHDEFIPSNEGDKKDAQRKMQQRIKSDLIKYLFPRVKALYPESVSRLFDGFDADKHLLVNPTGNFVIGGPHGDTGLTGRKIIVDTYGGRGAHGGGAFSGKDSTKVDRSGAYAARHLAKNMVAAGVAREILIQISYAIGVAEPVNIYVNTYGTNRTRYTDAELAEILLKNIPLDPESIEKRLRLRQPVFAETAAYGHFGRRPERKTKEFRYYSYEEKRHLVKRIPVELFTWEKTDMTDTMKALFF